MCLIFNLDLHSWFTLYYFVLHRNTFIMTNKIHHLKTWPDYFEKMVSGEKTFEARKNDRDFKVGDILNLQEWDNETEQYSGRELNVKVIHILRGGIFGTKRGHCFMSIEPLPQYKESDNDAEAKRLRYNELLRFTKWVNENLSSSGNLSAEDIVTLYMNIK